MKNGGFRQLIDPEIATEKAAQVGGMTTEITASQARKLKSLTGAEVILIGQVIATSRGEMGDLGPGWRSCTATISGRAVNTDNGDILSTDATTQRISAMLSLGASGYVQKPFGPEQLRAELERALGVVNA